MSTVLITGGNGFAGRHLATELINHGYLVSSLDRTQHSSERLFASQFQADITDAPQLSQIITDLKPQVIFHLAAIASPAYSFTHPQATFQVNVIGTINLLEAVRAVQTHNSSYHPKILMICSADPYGQVQSEDLPLTEQSAFNPTNPYAVSKVAVYYLAKQYAATYDLSIVIAIPFNHTGPGQRPGFFVPDMCQQIVAIEQNQAQPTIFTGNLQAARDLTDVRDIVRGYRLLLEQGQAGQAYQLCSGQPRVMAEVLQQLVSLSKEKIDHQLDPDRLRPSDIPMIYGSYHLANQLTGWKPEIPLEQTLKDTLEWYREQVS